MSEKRYSLKDELFNKIKKLYTDAEKNATEEMYSKDGRLASKVIFDALGKKVDYGTIKLAYAFLDI